MGVGPETPVIVGHTPLTNDETLWENVGNIENHHIIYGGDNKWMGVFTQINNKMCPLRYPTEALMPLIHAIKA